MGWIQRFFAWFWGKIMHRTGYQALVDGEIIYGCGQCKHNKHMRLFSISPMAHYCMISDLDAKGNPRVIYDPCDVPEYCKYRVVEATA